MKSIVLGTRGSPLAVAQTEIVRSLLAKAHPDLRVETKVIKTSGDQFHNLSLSAAGGKGLFTKEIEDHMLRGEIQVAVHSLKDLPIDLPDGLTIGAVPTREDARDVFISKRYATLDELPPRARVATSSIRRRAQLLARRPDLQIEEIRGNVETRLHKLVENDSLDALILAAAGLNRLELWDKVGDLHFQKLDVDVMIPAVGQGAIACEVRESDFETQELLAAINDADAVACAEAERTFLQALGGGCQVPYAAYAWVNGEQMRLIGARFSVDGKDVSRAETVGPRNDPGDLGDRAARQVLA